MIEEVRLNDLITLQRGFDITEEAQNPGSVPVISSGGISSYHNESKVNGPGVVIGRKGTLGKVYYSFENFWPHDTTLWIKDFKDNDPKFIYYLLQVLHFEKFDAGAANPTLNRNHVHSLKIKVPEKQYRRKIAQILTMYDDLIENNKQRIKLLQEMAGEIYKEWFVRLRFPGHETTLFYNKSGDVESSSSLELLPDEWKVSRLGDFCNFVMGQSPASEFYNNDRKGLPFHQGVTNFNNRFPDHVIFCTDLKRIADEGDILLSVRAPVGRINIATTKLVLGRGICSVKHKKGLQNYCFYLLKTIFSKEDSFGNGAVFNAVTKNDLLRIKAVEPSFEICLKFQALVKPIDEEIKVLTTKNQLLQQTRDLLLPRLISGKLSVMHLVEQFD